MNSNELLEINLRRFGQVENTNLGFKLTPHPSFSIVFIREELAKLRSVVSFEVAVDEGQVFISEISHTLI